LAAWAQSLPGLRPALTPQAPEAAFPTSFLALRAWHPVFHHWADLPFGVPPSLHLGGAGILTGCPSPTPFGLGLGPPNPTRMYLPSETLGFRRTRFSRVLRYSCRHSHFCRLHGSSRYRFYVDRTLPYQWPGSDPSSRELRSTCRMRRPRPFRGFGTRL
jgi:hypothetical protein